MSAIYIPTYKRCDTQYTLEALDTDSLPPVYLVAYPEEADELSMQGDVLVYDGERGIGKKRDFIVKHHKENGDDPYCIMLDDDLGFMVRKDRSDMKKWQLRDASLDETTELLQDMLHTVESLADVPVCGADHRQGNNNKDKESLIFNSRLFANWAMDVDFFTDRQIFFDDTYPGMEDFFAWLSILTSGNRVGMICDRAVCDRTGSNGRGGNSVERSLENQARTAKALKALFPDFVTLVERKTKTGWYGDVPRLDVRIQWKKAYEWGLENKV